jgi:glycosyltransferase involved in cell wall biosynthesis
MARLLVDGLSVNNLSGRYVLLGHLSKLVKSRAGDLQVRLVTHQGNADWRKVMPDTVEFDVVSLATGDWRRRWWWAQRHAARYADRHGIDLVFSPSGMMGFGWQRPQVVLAQNPWPLVPELHRSSADRVRAWLQRRGFAAAQRDARRMVFNSRFMADLYAAHFGAPTQAATVAYQGLDDDLLARGRLAPAVWSQRSAAVLCVSVMARHKNVEALVRAIHRLAAQGVGAHLHLVGGWPDAAYRREIDALVDSLALGERVTIHGHVSQEDLHRLYGQVRAYALLSRCESFGIPALEAQAFSTPALVATGTAAPEIIGAGGAAVGPDAVEDAAQHLGRWLTDAQAWAVASAAARANAEAFRWEEVSRPLMAALDSALPARA